MDNFRRPRRAAARRPGNVDGFVPSRKSDGSIPSDFRRTSSYRPNNSYKQSIGGFSGKEGFRSATAQSKIAPASASSAGSIALDQPMPRKQPDVAAIPGKKSKKKKDKSQHKWRRRILRTFLVLSIIAIIIGGYLFVKGYMKSRNILKGGGNAAALQENVDPSQLKGEGDGRVNVLLLGKGGDGHEGPDLTDTILLASIDPVHKEASLVSIPRDFWVKTPSGGYAKINSVYANAKYAVMNKRKYPNQAKDAEEAGLTAIQNTTSQVLGVPIHYHAIVDFEAFKEAVDSVGGVDLNAPSAVKESLWIEGTNKVYNLNVQPGMQHFDGMKALMYSRSRHTSPRGDFDRAERQRAIMIALKEKVLTLGTFSNPVKISQLIDAFGNHVATDFTQSEIVRLYQIGKEIPGNKVVSVGLADPPNNYITTSMISGQSVVIPRAGVGNYAEIQSYIRNTLKDSYIRDENASIIVLNGTNTAGLATKYGNGLKSYGYNIASVGDAPTKGVQKTQLIDLRNGSKKYTQHYLESRLGVSATSTLPAGVNAGTADFVIILGQDQANASF